MLCISLLPISLGFLYLYAVATLPDYDGMRMKYESLAKTVVESQILTVSIYRGPFEEFLQEVTSQPLLEKALESQMPKPVADYIYSLLPSRYHISIVEFIGPRSPNYVGILPYDADLSSVQKIVTTAIVYLRFQSELTGLTVPLFVFVLERFEEPNIFETAAYYVGHALNLSIIFPIAAGVVFLFWLIFVTATVGGTITAWKKPSRHIQHVGLSKGISGSMYGTLMPPGGSRFCLQCGQRLRASSNYCLSCGAQTRKKHSSTIPETSGQEQLVLLAEVGYGKVANSVSIAEQPSLLISPACFASRIDWAKSVVA